jgi:hypothetical protein
MIYLVSLYNKDILQIQYFASICIGWILYYVILHRFEKNIHLKSKLMRIIIKDIFKFTPFILLINYTSDLIRYKEFNINKAFETLLKTQLILIVINVILYMFRHKLSKHAKYTNIIKEIIVLIQTLNV